MHHFFGNPRAGDIRKDYLNTPLVVGEGAYTNIPPHLTQWAPKYRDDNESRWRWDPKNKVIVFAKHWPDLAAEKISTDLANKLELPVPPGRLWQRGDAVWFTSVLAFPRAGRQPSFQLLKKDENFPAMAVFDLWTQNIDRRHENITHDHGKRQFAYIDYEYTLGRDQSDMPRTSLLAMHGKFFNEEWFPHFMPANAGFLWKALQSPKAEDAIRKIERLSPQAIAETVERLPGRLFSGISLGPQAAISDELCERRLHLRPLIAENIRQSTLAP